MKTECAGVPLTPSSIVQDVLTELATLGFRLTGQRRTLVQLLLARERRFTADELMRDLRSQGLSVGRATVFRTLDLLTRLGYLGRVPDGERRGYVRCVRGHHHHLTCSGCGEVVPIAECPAGDLLDDLVNQTGFIIDQHSLEVTGLCPMCQDTR